MIETPGEDPQDPPVFLYEGWGKTRKESRRNALSGYRTYLRWVLKQVNLVWFDP